MKTPSANVAGRCPRIRLLLLLLSALLVILAPAFAAAFDDTGFDPENPQHLEQFMFDDIRVGVGIDTISVREIKLDCGRTARNPAYVRYHVFCSGRWSGRLDMTNPRLSHPVNHARNGYTPNVTTEHIFVKGGMPEVNQLKSDGEDLEIDLSEIQRIKDRILESKDWKYAIKAYDLDPDHLLDLDFSVDTLRVDISRYEGMTIEEAKLSALGQTVARASRMAANYQREDAERKLYRPTGYTFIPTGTSLDGGIRYLNGVVAVYPLRDLGKGLNRFPFMRFLFSSGLI